MRGDLDSPPKARLEPLTHAACRRHVCTCLHVGLVERCRQLGVCPPIKTVLLELTLNEASQSLVQALFSTTARAHATNVRR